MKLEGTTEDIPLRELIEMIAYSSVTGVLNIYTDSASGHIYFRDGHLYHCDSRDSAGLDALAGLFALHRANFSFVSDVTSDQESLWGDMDYHLQTAERLAHRWAAVRPSITSLDLIPALIIPFELAIRRVGPAHHQILDRIDGQHTIRAITDDLGWAMIDVAEAIAQLSRDSLIDLRHQGQGQEPEPATPQRGGLFNRLLSRASEPARQVGPAPLTISAEEMVLRVLRS
ncbi:DUF4388 domain-containing protein [Oscillochloris sp. ZM17-4]|uniref:DUF4388 domain-containing protein n=1 Tax=Oscillochloris sp. ZM17-4 TaxID=2866714 RepID=UPI001C72D26B|nr:DUF4388 domain-containing protein [Oscillochloris sp. ZM17-4]